MNESILASILNNDYNHKQSQYVLNLKKTLSDDCYSVSNFSLTFIIV